MDDLHIEALVLNDLWRFANTTNIRGHPYYRCIAQDMKAFVRSYNGGQIKDEDPTNVRSSDGTKKE